MPLTERLAGRGVLFLPGALLVFLSFNAGGYFAGAPALVAVVLLLCLAARILIAERPFAGLSPQLGVCAGALALYALWILLSASWSHSTWRAMVEFDRALLYLAALVLFGSIPRAPERVRWMIRGLALGILIVCASGLITRVLPHVWPIAPDLARGRLSYPLTYWNALGLMGSLGTILCFHFACSRSEHPAVRVTGAAAVPLLVTTVFFTLSRGAIAAGAIGLLSYVVLARPKAFVSGLFAVLPPTVAALLVSYHADLLTGPNPTSQAAVHQGHHVAVVLGASVLAASMLRLFLLRFERRRSPARLSPKARRVAFASAATLAVVAATGLAVAVDVPGYVSHQYDRFLRGGAASTGAGRLTEPGNNGRLDYWRVALEHGYARAPLKGEGAGTYELVWAAYRPKRDASLTVHNAHSLYVENLSDLGWVGLSLVVVFVITILYGFAARLGGPDRALYAALFAAGVAWALHAGVDLDWRMPAVTIWFFAIGGAVLAATPSQKRLWLSPPLLVRAGIAVAMLLLAVIPARVAISQAKMNEAAQTLLRNGDCPRAISQADDAISVLGVRPDAYWLKGYCQVRLGRTRQAVISMRKAVDRDPNDWRFRYSLAVAEASAGINPRPAARQALRLDPLEPEARDLVNRLRSAESRDWRSQARLLLRVPPF